MRTFRGIAVFPGVAIGPALLLDKESVRVFRQHVAADEVDAESNRLLQALKVIAAEIGDYADMVKEKMGPQVAMIFEAHRQMVADPHLHDLFLKRIREEHCSAEFAVRLVMREYQRFFEQAPSDTFVQRANDLKDLEDRVIRHLVGSRQDVFASLTHKVIVLAHDLTPSETASLNPALVVAMATETGGRTSHTAIIAGAMEIPAVVGLGTVLHEIKDGDTVIVDGHRGVLIINPDEPNLRKYQNTARDLQLAEVNLEKYRDLPAETTDGARISLLGNIEFPLEAEHCLARGAEGVGLYRTEFLYLNRETPPTEDEHYQAYAEVLKAMGGHPVVFRTMDMGADKLAAYSGWKSDKPEPNPFLGLRSIRLSLKHREVFKTQLRALLRVSVLGKIKIMFPLISTLQELRHCRVILGDVRDDLEEEGIPFDPSIPIGMMVEVPSAALLADHFAQYVDFFSIGTNDLIQYALAVDRNNETVARLYSASDPSVLLLIDAVVNAAARHGTSVSVCGEMSGDPIYAILLVGLGIRTLSLTPHNIPEIKRVLREIDSYEAREVAREALRKESAVEVNTLLRDRFRHYLSNWDVD